MFGLCNMIEGSRSPFSLSRLFSASTFGGIFDPSDFSRTRQTYNAPATQCTAAGDPIGLLMPAQVNESIVNLLLWTDHFDNAAWTKTNVTATADVRGNYQGVPTADLLNATSGGGTCSQSATVTADTATNIAGVDLEVGTATASKVQLVYSGGNTYTASITWSGGVPTVTAADSATSGDVSGTLVATGIYRITVKGANTSRSSVALTIQPGGASTGTVYASRASISIGSTEQSYQPNAACLGGSNRRTGGSNLQLWTERTFNNTNTNFFSINNLVITDLSATAADGGLTAATIAPTAASGSLVRYIEPANYSVNAISGVTYTAYVDAKYGNAASNGIALAVRNAAGSNRARANFNLSTHAVPSITIEGGNWTAGTATVTALSNGMYRHSITFTVTTSSEQLSIGVYLNAYTSTADTYGSVVIDRLGMNIGSTPDTYSRNMEVVGGLLTSMVPYNTTSANRGTLARRPRRGIANRAVSSSDLSTAAWGASSISRTASTIIEAAASALHRIDNTIPEGRTSGDVWTVTLRCRAIGSRNLYLNAAAFTRAATNFNLSNGTVNATALGSATIIADGSYYICSVTGTANATGGTPIYLQINTNALATDQTYVGDGTSGIEITHYQVEKGSFFTGFQTNNFATSTSFTSTTESGQPDVWESYYDGVSDYLDTGVQSVGTCSWFAAAGQAWSLEGDYRTVATGVVQTICAKASATAGNRTLMVYIDTDNIMKVNCRGTVTSTGITVTDGVFHIWEMVWDASTLTLWLDGVSYAITVGSAAEEAQNFTIGCRTASSPASFFNGHNDVLVNIDRGLSAAERSQSHLTNNTTYRYGLPA